MPNPTLYFGDDSVALLLRLRPRHGGTCLDLCAGPGVQALHCGRLASSVDAVEVNPVAATLASINVAMNGLDGRVTVRRGSLFESVAGRVFDTVVANPPLLPFPSGVEYPFVGHGGDDGLRVTRAILEGLPAALAPGGTAQVIGTSLEANGEPEIVPELRAWAAAHRMDLLLTVVSRRPLRRGSGFFEGLVATAAACPEVGTDPSKIAERLERLLERKGASHLASWFLHINWGDGSLDVMDLARSRTGNGWYADPT
jgi:methylase of polypeptide subunit release factors